MTEQNLPQQAQRRLVIEGLRKIYGSGPNAKTVLDGLTFDVDIGEFVCIVGPSGAGKTTLLKCLAGLLPPTSGRAYLDGEVITGPPEKLALVFQEYTRSLMPWLTVEKNVTLPLVNKGVSKRERRERAREALEAVGLADVPRYYPWQLSGGMQQRVAIARALAYQPEVLVMDEPFASVDAQTRFELEDLAQRVREQFGVTVVFVTHDIDEAVYLADRVVVLGGSPCRVREIIPVELEQPRDQVQTKADPAFTELRSRVFELIRKG
ncbi:ABC transporter ATP-binding protein [Haloechinothrix sp. LS1_15]|uniref:ABC transporter ATP-binding protein n=1 Tax=Haloechinothrix sp. LS1_15 TaxID=2652248 RepID=UPI0037BECCEF